MTSLKFSTAVHIMLLLAHLEANAPGRAASSSNLAGSIGANAVVVRRVLSSLASAGLILTKAGASGGAWLAKKPSKIHLDEIYAAVEEPAGPGFRAKGNAACPVGRAAPGVICGLLDDMQKASQAVLKRQTLANLLKTLEAAAR